MGVPSGSGVRMGIDRDEDGVLNADVPAPSLQISRLSNNIVVSWPLSASAYTLQTATALSNWNDSSDPLEIIGTQNYVTNPIASTAKFYRLKLSAP